MPDEAAAAPYRTGLSFAESAFGKADRGSIRTIQNRALALLGPALAVGAVLLVAPAAGLLPAGWVLSGAAGLVSGGAFAYLATLPRRGRRLLAGLLVVTAVLALAGGLIALYLQTLPRVLSEAGVGSGRFAFGFAFGMLNVALLRRGSTERGQHADS